MKILQRYRAAAVGLALSLIAFVPQIWAQTPALSLTQALATAQEQNPTTDIARERVSAAEGIRTQAGLMPNPVLTATSENEPLSDTSGFTFADQTDDYIYASQMIELGGKRRRRVAAAQAGVAVAGVGAEISARKLDTRVASAYWAANGAALVRDLYQNEVNMLDRMAGYNRARVRAGAAAQADLLRIQLESDRMLAEVNLAAAEAARALIALYREMGASDFPSEVRFVDALESRDRPVSPPIEVVLRDRPEMRLANENLTQAQANASLERANAVPDPDLMFGYKRWSGYDRFTGLDALFFGVKVPLPLFNRNQGKIAVADADLRMARRALDAEKITILAEVASALSDYQRSADTIDRIMPSMSDRAGRNLEITREAYRIGGTDLIRYLDAERMRIETRVLYVRALTQYHQSVVDLEYATGMMIR